VAWVAGERERYLEFYRLRQSRTAYRYQLELALMAPSMAPYLAAQDDFAALVRDAEQHRLPPDEEFPDSKVVVNQNLY
jgi:hypothetical protein